MNSLTIGPREFFQQVRQLEGEVSSTNDQKAWYWRSTPRNSRLQALVNWPQRVLLSGIREATMDAAETESKDVGETKKRACGWLHSTQTKSTSSADVRIFAKLPSPDVKAFDVFVTAVSHEASKTGVEAWNKIFAYTDFDAMPLYISILTLAATEEKNVDLPVRRVFVERCRRSIRARGMADGLIEIVQDRTKSVPRRDQYLRSAHMVACLEEQTATKDYIKAAIAFEKLGDIRSALACVYRNTRYRLRDGQAKELDEDVRTFDIDEAGIDTMLAVLTATAPIKSSLPSRKALYRGVRRTLKKRCQLEYGLLDGLK